MTEREQAEQDGEIEQLRDVAMSTLVMLHTLAPNCSEALADTVGRALIRFVELCRKGTPIAKPGEEEYVTTVVEAVAARMYVDLVDDGMIDPPELKN